MQNLERLTHLTTEFEGLLHVLARRDDLYIRNLLKSKYSDLAEEFSVLQSYFELTPPVDVNNETEVSTQNEHIETPEEEVEADAENEIADDLQDVDREMTEEEVKDQEAVESEVPDEDEAAEKAVAEEEHMESDEDLLQDENEDENEDEDDDIATFVFEDEDDEDEEENVENEESNADRVIDLGSLAEQEPKEQPQENKDWLDDALGIDLDFVNESKDARNEQPTTSMSIGDVARTTSAPSVDDMLRRQEATDLKRVFTLNDKMRFRRALFGQDDQRFADALARLAVLPTYADACRVATNEFGWTLTNPDVADFMSIIKPHYPDFSS